MKHSKNRGNCGHAATIISGRRMAIIDQRKWPIKPSGSFERWIPVGTTWWLRGLELDSWSGWWKCIDRVLRYKFVYTEIKRTMKAVTRGILTINPNSTNPATTKQIIPVSRSRRKISTSPLKISKTIWKKSRKITCTTRTRSRTDQNRNMFEKIGPEYNSCPSWMFSRFKCESLMHASRLRRMEKRQSVPGIYFVNHEEHGTGTFWYAAHRCLYTGLN